MSLPVHLVYTGCPRTFADVQTKQNPPMSEIDRLPIADAQASSGMGRSAFYRRLTQAGVVPIKVSGRSFLSGDDLQAMARLASWIDKGGDPEQWPGRKNAAAPPAGGALAPSSAPQQLAMLQPQADVEADSQAPHELVIAELDLLERLLPFLTKASEQGWTLPGSTVELLIGARPRGQGIERYGFSFTPSGSHGRERAWSVSKIRPVRN